MKTRSLSVGALAAVLAALAASNASPQSVNRAAKPNPAVDLNALRQQILTLESRVAELEKAQSRRADATAGAEKLTIVTAPFVVQERAGQPLMRVQEAGQGGLSRGIHVYDGTGPVAHVGINRTGGGRVYVASTGTDKRPVGALAASPTEGSMFALHNDQKDLLDVNEQGLTYYNGAGHAIVKLGSGDGQAGFFQIADRNGIAAVEAGMTKAGRAVVRVFPNDGRTPVPWPQFLMGGKP